jgi:hypothetical protein
MKAFYVVAALVSLAGLIDFVGLYSAKDQSDDPRASLIGNWTGDSVCAGNRPACHNEKVVYKISLTRNQASSVTIEMYKIVDDKPDLMGTFDFVYNASKQTLESEFTRGQTHGLWQFTLEQKVMKGVLLILPAKELGRNVTVKKSD